MITAIKLRGVHNEVLLSFVTGGNIDDVKSATDFERLIINQHYQNYLLWSLEDEARNPKATNDQIAKTKKSIDATNQRRNNFIEKLDSFLYEHIFYDMPHVLVGLPLASETPGQMIDRLSILHLKIHYTNEQLQRGFNLNPGLYDRLKQQLEGLLQRHTDLRLCFDNNMTGFFQRKLFFRIYQSYKMYNDPRLNPAIYNNQ